MKPFVRKSLQVLWLMVLVSACRNQDVDPLYPASLYALKTFPLNPAPLTKPASVPVVALGLSQSGLWTATNADITSFATSGQFTANLTDASTSMSQALTSAGVSAPQLIAGFTQDVINILATQRTLDGGLQKMVTDVVAHPNMKAYLPTFTYGKVNGQEIGLTYKTPEQSGPSTPMIAAFGISPVNYTGSDSHYQVASSAYDERIVELEAIRARQVNLIQAAYENEKVAIDNDMNTALRSNANKYSALIVAAWQNVNNNLQNLNAVKNRLDNHTYNTLAAWLCVLYASQIKLYDQLQLADTNVQRALKDGRLIANQTARDADINKINGDFNTALAAARDQLNRVLDLQGGGR